MRKINFQEITCGDFHEQKKKIIKMGRQLRGSLQARMLALNNNIASRNVKGVRLSKNLKHAWFQVMREGKVYVFNGNDGLQGIPHEYPTSADGSVVMKGIRALDARVDTILQHKDGLCFLVSAAISKAYYKFGKDDWYRFMDYCMNCTEEKLYYDFINK